MLPLWSQNHARGYAAVGVGARHERGGKVYSALMLVLWGGTNMADSKELHCPRCDGAEFASQDDRIVCMGCGHSMKFEDLQILAMIKVLTEDVEATRH